MNRPILDVTPPPGVRARPYAVWRDAVYRLGLAVATAGLILRAAGHPTVGAWLAGTGALLAAWMFFVWVPVWRTLVIGLAAAGFPLWGVGWVPWAFGSWMAAMSVMAAKETHCFHFPAGRFIPWVSLVVGVAALFPVPPVELRVGEGVVASLWVWLAADRWRLPWLRLTAEASRSAATPPRDR
jgi:hypothetical protein